MPKTVLSINRLLKKSFFLGSIHELTRAKYYPQACLKQTGVFLKNNKLKPSRPSPFRVAFASLDGTPQSAF